MSCDWSRSLQIKCAYGGSWLNDLLMQYKWARGTLLIDSSTTVTYSCFLRFRWFARPQRLWDFESFSIGLNKYASKTENQITSQMSIANAFASQPCCEANRTANSLGRDFGHNRFGKAWPSRVFGGRELHSFAKRWTWQWVCEGFQFKKVCEEKEFSKLRICFDGKCANLLVSQFGASWISQEVHKYLLEQINVKMDLS